MSNYNKLNYITTSIDYYIDKPPRYVVTYNEYNKFNNIYHRLLTEHKDCLDNIKININELMKHVDQLTEGTVPDNSVTDVKLVDNSVGTSKIKNGAVTDDKLANNINPLKIKQPCAGDVLYHLENPVEDEYLININADNVEPLSTNTPYAFEIIYPLDLKDYRMFIIDTKSGDSTKTFKRYASTASEFGISVDGLFTEEILGTNNKLRFDIQSSSELNGLYAVPITGDIYTISKFNTPPGELTVTLYIRDFEIFIKNNGLILRFNVYASIRDYVSGPHSIKVCSASFPNIALKLKPLY